MTADEDDLLAREHLHVEEVSVGAPAEATGCWENADCFHFEREWVIETVIGGIGTTKFPFSRIGVVVESGQEWDMTYGTWRRTTWKISPTERGNVEFQYQKQTDYQSLDAQVMLD